MKSYKLLVLLFSVCVAGLYKTTHAELVNLETNNGTESGHKENKTVIELNKDITVNTGLNLDKTLAQLNVTEASNVPKIRKVTHVDNDSMERKLKTKVNITAEAKNISTAITTTIVPQKLAKILTEAGMIAIKEPNKNGTAIVNVISSAANSNKSIEVISKEVKNSNTNSTLTTKLSTTILASTTTKPIISIQTNLNTTNVRSTAKNITSSTMKILNDNRSTTPTVSSTATNTNTTTTTTTTTTTPKPKKPTVTYSVPDFPDLEKDNPELNNLLQSSASIKLPLPDGPYAQPSKEFNSSFHRGRDFILPIVSMIFIIPLVIGIIITSYRRFRDCWTTRHYRRMDFLVDGMYND